MKSVSWTYCFPSSTTLLNRVNQSAVHILNVGWDQRQIQKLLKDVQCQSLLMLISYVMTLGICRYANPLPPYPLIPTPSPNPSPHNNSSSPPPGYYPRLGFAPFNFSPAVTPRLGSSPLTPHSATPTLVQSVLLESENVSLPPSAPGEQHPSSSSRKRTRCAWPCFSVAAILTWVRASWPQG